MALKASSALEKHPLLFILVLSFAITLINEILGRHSAIGAVSFLFNYPLRFAANMFIVMLALSVSLLFKKRVFFIFFFSLLWLGLGITNGVVQFFRIAPFGFIDITLLPSIITIFGVYLKPWQIVLVVIAVLLALFFIVLVFIKTVKRAAIYKKAGISVLITAVCLACSFGITFFGHGNDNIEAIANIVEAYRQYGFSYSFMTGAFDRGITRPDFYSRDAVVRLVSSLKDSPETNVRPNIIMVQLESFFDPSYLENIELNENPIPVFTRLRDNYSSGFLTVPSVGAGTVNTEFEVLTGMSLDYFGLGEYPYSTVLREEACCSVARDLRALGYTAHAVHNNSATFYDRNIVFAQLGFDDFISIEYMEDVEYNPIGWAKDSILTNEISEALDSTPGRDFVFTVTVQGHGKYDLGEDFADTDGITITEDEDEDEAGAIAYYLSQLRETDEFIGSLVSALSRRAEPTVLVLYGDHLPNLDISPDDLQSGDLYATEYVIWDNMNLPEEDRDLSSFRLTAEVFKKLGLNGGILSKYHSTQAEKSYYDDGLKLLQYDMLYGKYYCYGGANPYRSSPLTMGVTPIVITDAVWAEGRLTVFGTHLTPFSRIAVNGNELDTEFEGKGIISAELKAPPNEEDIITVRQVSSTSEILSESVGMHWGG